MIVPLGLKGRRLPLWANAEERYGIRRVSAAGPAAPFPQDLIVDGVTYPALVAMAGNDASASGWLNRGTLGGTAAAIGTGGQFGQSTDFAGLEAVELQGTRAFELARAIDFGEDSIVVEAVVRTPTTQSINQWISNTETNPVLDLRLSNPYVPTLTLVDSSGTAAAPNGGTVPADSWLRLFVLLSRQGGNLARFYVNDALTGQASPGISGAMTLSSPLRLGQRFASASGQNFQGGLAWWAAWRVDGSFDPADFDAVNEQRHAQFGPSLTSSDFSDDWE